ncbi:MAG: pseudouridine synthase [Betaproteobacteria bacterium]|nr:pseudouridine synthase [Betaproteobacteria bacterium]
MSAPHSRPPRSVRSPKSSDTPFSDDGETADPSSQKLQKVLAAAGFGSRREMEEWISNGRVSVNGEIATLGTRITEADRVLADRRPVRWPFSLALPRVLIYHKPEGEIVSRDDPGARQTVFENLPKIKNGKWIAIGRLDFNTEGLLIFTSDGELANRLMHPSFAVEREYAVRIMGELTREHMQQLTSGIELDDGLARFERIMEEGGDNSNRWYRVVIREGRNREIRRMFAEVGMMVSRLIRVRFGVVNLPARVKRGKMMELDVKQIVTLLKWAGMPVPDVLPQTRPQDKRR